MKKRPQTFAQCKRDRAAILHSTGEALRQVSRQLADKDTYNSILINVMEQVVAGKLTKFELQQWWLTFKSYAEDLKGKTHDEVFEELGLPVDFRLQLEQDRLNTEYKIAKFSSDLMEDYYETH